MKKMNKFCAMLLVAIMALTTPISAFAEENSSVNAVNEVEQLKKDIAKIQKVDPANVQEFYNKNKEWIADVNTRLEEYIADVPEDQRDIKLKELRGDNLVSIPSVSDYFNSYQYHQRGGYWTYSMTPKMSTRLLRTYANAGWDELSEIYYYIRNDSGGLHDQYMCH